MNDAEQAKPAKEVILSPGEIAKMTEAAALGKAAAGTVQHVGDDRSAQLSTPHTPGHTVNRR